MLFRRSQLAKTVNGNTFEIFTVLNKRIVGKFACMNCKSQFYFFTVLDFLIPCTSEDNKLNLKDGRPNS